MRCPFSSFQKKKKTKKNEEQQEESKRAQIKLCRISLGVHLGGGEGHVVELGHVRKRHRVHVQVQITKHDRERRCGRGDRVLGAEKWQHQRDGHGEERDGGDEGKGRGELPQRAGGVADEDEQPGQVNGVKRADEGEREAPLGVLGVVVLRGGWRVEEVKVFLNECNLNE